MKISSRRYFGLALAVVSFTTCFSFYLSGVSMQVVTKQVGTTAGRWDVVTTIGVIHIPALIFTAGTVIGLALLAWPRTKTKGKPVDV